MLPGYVYAVAIFGFLVLTFTYLVNEDELKQRNFEEYNQGGSVFDAADNAKDLAVGFLGMFWDLITFDIPGLPAFIRFMFIVIIDLPILAIIVDLTIRVVEAIFELVPF